MRKRLVNFRPLLFVFVGMLLGAFFVESLVLQNRTKTIVVLFVFGLIVAIALGGMIKARKSEKGSCGESGRILKTMMLIVLSFVMTICLMFGVIGRRLSKFDEFDSGTAELEIEIAGRVKSESANQVVLDYIVHNEKQYNGVKICLYALDYQAYNFEIGTVVYCKVKLERQTLTYNGRLNTALLLNRIYYSGFICEDEVQVAIGDGTPFENFKARTDKMLAENMSEQAHGICKALLFGDKTDIDTNIYDAYKLSGLAHVLSVSGLHVGFIVALISFLLKKFKANASVQFVVIVCFLVFYCCMCDFASSVVRASVMSSIGLLSLIVKRKTDRISNISLSGVILLFINPAYALDIGFQLSFLAVLGIMLFCTPITNALNRIKLPNFLSSTIAVTLSAEIATLPVIAKAFGYIAPISLIANIVVLPIFSCVFCLLFLAFLFNLIFFFGAPYFLLGKAITSLGTLTSILSKVGVIGIKSFGTIGTVAYYSLLAINSKYFIHYKEFKIFLTIFYIIFMAISIFTYNF